MLVNQSPPRTEGQHQNRIPVWRLRVLNLQAADSAPVAAQSHHALIESPARKCDDRKKPVHWCRQTGTQEYDVNLYQEAHFALWEQAIATQAQN
ncbi:hypothetical protein RN38_00665 [Hafnia paralvei]|uniref:Uncharacterized protein n=3 Tax=Enterobacteriaceae TaxID=543 RepID=A0A1I9W6V6_SALTM|nr:hypothetical protein KPH11_73 [Klebsiella pneumoniae subsp. pneumoniae]APA22907.1 hypothetical protein [Salmonella enterica subsp. enterica serovar Typhimurium]KHS51477.1 hypothetical protein RN38_00665 [Hafnia paralvei]